MNNKIIKIDDEALEYIKSLTLMCVDNNEDVRFNYEAIFENMFKELIFAVDGQDGYEKYLNQDIDIIITDYSMPVSDGLDMIQKIRSKDKDIPIILVTAIHDSDVVIKALQLHTNNFILKPIDLKKLYDAIEECSKIFIANNYLQKQKNLKIKTLEEKDKYNSYQEDLAFAKELNILRNDFYYQMINDHWDVLVDFSYQPLDILSGDAYSARQIDKTTTFYLIVDGMGKGLSASLSSMLVTSFINHTIDIMKSSNNFDLYTLVDRSIQYMKPILLDEEALSIDYVVLDSLNLQIDYATFAMPAILLQTQDKKIIKLKSNNPPISKYIDSFKISTYDVENITKFLFYSDGMVENSTRFKEKLYVDYIEEDFLDSFTKESMKERLSWKINNQEDDITFIFINKLDLKNTIIAQNSFETDLKVIDKANDWYDSIWNDLTHDIELSSKASIVFTELYMNAYEHGNLGLDTKTKNKLILDDTYMETLTKMQQKCNKKISVSVNKITYNKSIYIITQIEDEGDGFDTQILSQIFRNARSFSGRGVFVSRSSSLGIYYNAKGNSVLFLHKL